jgi:hypothetical protein
VSIESFNAELLIKQFIALAQLPEPPIAEVREKLEQFRSQLDEQYDRIFMSTLQIA